MSTLISVMLVIGLAIMFQSLALSNTKTMKRLVRAETDRLNTQSVRELIRPVLAEALIQYDQPDRLPLDGTQIYVKFDGKTFSVSALAEITGGKQPKDATVVINARDE